MTLRETAQPTHVEVQGETDTGSAHGRLLLAGGALAFLATGLLLWWREGERLFTDGLIAAIVACF